MQRRAVSLLLALLWGAGAVHGATPPGARSSAEARAWIERMNHAVVNRNYIGVLEHRWGNDGLEFLRVVHRMKDGHMSERVVFLSSRNEVTRNGSKYVEYDRRKRIAKGQTLNRSYGYISAFNGISAESDKYYEISNGGTHRLKDYAGPVQMISVIPRDAFRYGYRFWLDKDSAMPIKTELLGANQVVLDEIAFVTLSLPDSIDDEALKPAVNVKNWMRPAEAATAVTRAFVPQARLLPQGFRVLPLPPENADAKGPRTRFIVSDGIAWVSVFVTGERHEEGSREAPGAGTYTHVHRQDGHYITAVGGVPPATVKMIAEAVLPE
jgi:sigma-E factor negative regulatory protein RseB